MSQQNLKTRITLRKDSSANWLANNPVLLKGEPSIELDTGKIKFGDGVTAYKDLKYSNVTPAELFGADGKIKDELINLPEVKRNTVYEGQKVDLKATDQSIIDAYFAEHSDIELVQHDVFVVTAIADGVTYSKSGYVYNGTKWVALNGEVDADKVIFTEDLIMAGSYDKIGNFTKPLNGTGTIAAKGKSVMDIFTQMTAKELQPTITGQPAVSGFALTGAKAVEAGTKVDTATFGTATLSAGAYTYGSANVKASKYVVDRVCNPTSMSENGIVEAPNGTDNNSGNGFIIGDQGGDNAVSSLAYKVTVTHGAGEVAKTNLGNSSNPTVQIAAGTKVKQTSAYTAFRKYFYGSPKTAVANVDSAYIRSLTNSSAAYKAQTLTLTVPAGATRVDIACIGTAKGVTKVINETALNADVTATFVKSTVNVEGANGYTAVPYNVWSFIPPEPYGNQAVLKVTLG